MVLYGCRTTAFAVQLPTRLLSIKPKSQLPCSGQSPFSAFKSRPRPPLWKTKPAWFLIAEEDRMINPKTLHFMADRMHAKIHSYPVDHSPMYTEPKLVINIILEAARETLST